MPFTVPGIGYAGLGQQTAAAQQVFRRAMGGGSARPARSGKRKRAKAARASRRSSSSTFRRPRRIPGKSRTRRTRGQSKMVKGSAAAKRHMARLRRMKRK